MGASCSTSAVSTGRVISKTLKPVHDDGKAASSNITTSCPDGPQATATLNYDTDDEEMMDLSKVPKFARELIIKLRQEEEDIESDDIDPILFTKIRPSSLRYEFFRENGTKQLFRAESLIDYMLATCQFHDPETRIDFSNEQLKDLDEIGSQLNKPSVYVAKVDGAWLRQKQEEEQNAFSGVERCCGEHVYQMLKIIERAKKDRGQEGEVDLLIKCFPSYKHYLTLMFNLDKDATMVAVDQYRIFLQGPPNRPTQDRTKRLLKYCLNFLDQVNIELWKLEKLQ